MDTLTNASLELDKPELMHRVEKSGHTAENVYFNLNICSKVNSIVVGEITIGLIGLC